MPASRSEETLLHGGAARVLEVHRAELLLRLPKARRTKRKRDQQHREDPARVHRHLPDLLWTAVRAIHPEHSGDLPPGVDPSNLFIALQRGEKRLAEAKLGGRATGSRVAEGDERSELAFDA